MEFVRVFATRAVQRAEFRGGRDAWQEMLTTCSRCESAVKGAKLSAGASWISAATLVASTYHPIVLPAGSTLQQMATENSNTTNNPCLAAESCLFLAWVAWSTGDGPTANNFLNASQAARCQPQRPPQSQARAPLPPTSAGLSSWQLLSGPGSAWRELSLRCLISEQLGYPGSDRDPTVALSNLNAAVSAVDASVCARGPPLAERDLSGSLALAKASVLIKLGELEEARSVVTIYCDGILHKCAGRTGEGETTVLEKGSVDVEQKAACEVGESEEHEHSRKGGGLGGAKITPSLRCRALCVASDVDVAEGLLEDAKLKLREVLAADGGCAAALTRLGWLLLGFARDGVRGGGDGECATAEVIGEGVDRQNTVAEAAVLLERAAKEEPACAMHAFRLAR